MNVSILGASQKPARYSYQAVKLLIDTGHTVFPIHPLLTTIADRPVFKRLREIPAPIHTITVYLGPEQSSALVDDILAISPRRVIFNPGTENPELTRQLQANGITALNVCTLVLLRTDRFDLCEMGETVVYKPAGVSHSGHVAAVETPIRPVYAVTADPEGAS